jgi:hypothetical protein
VFIRKKILVNLLVINGFGLFLSGLLAQNRLNKPLPLISSSTIGRLTKAMGWMLNPAGQWVSRSNRIPVSTLYFIDYAKTGLGVDNFYSYEFRNLTIGDSSYVILFKNFRYGSYDYPSVQEGWEDYNRYMFYVFSKREFGKLSNIIFDSVNIIKLSYYLVDGDIAPNFGSSTNKINEAQNLISQMLLEGKQNTDSSKFLVFQIAPYKAKKLVQFQIYCNESITGNVGGIIEEHTVSENPSDVMAGNREIYFSKELFEYCYFETDLCSFNKFISLNIPSSFCPELKIKPNRKRSK